MGQCDVIRCYKYSAKYRGNSGLVQGQRGSPVYPTGSVRNPAGVVRLSGQSSAISDRGEERWLLTGSQWFD